MRFDRLSTAGVDRSVLVDVWPEACRHIEIEESTHTIGGIRDSREYDGYGRVRSGHPVVFDGFARSRSRSLGSCRCLAGGMPPYRNPGVDPYDRWDFRKIGAHRAVARSQDRPPAIVLGNGGGGRFGARLSVAGGPYCVRRGPAQGSSGVVPQAAGPAPGQFAQRSTTFWRRSFLPE